MKARQWKLMPWSGFLGLSGGALAVVMILLSKVFVFGETIVITRENAFLELIALPLFFGVLFMFTYKDVAKAYTKRLGSQSLQPPELPFQSKVSTTETEKPE